MNYLRMVPEACVLIMGASLAWSAVSKNAGQNPETKPINVTMKSLSYDPKKLEIHVGESVVWTNKSFAKHTATSDDDGKTFDTGDVIPEESSKPMKFHREGEFNYHCKTHGKSMSGTIVVKKQ